MCITACRGSHCDLEASVVVGVGPVHALPSACLEEVEEQPEDADNQRNVTRTGGQPSDLSTAVRIPVTLTGPPGQTTVAPSEYLPSAAAQAPLCGPTLCSFFPSCSAAATWGQSWPLGRSQLESLCCRHLCLHAPLLSRAQRSTVTVTGHLSLSLLASKISASSQVSARHGVSAEAQQEGA